MREVSIAERVLLETLKHIYAEVVVANLTSIKRSVKDLTAPNEKTWKLVQRKNAAGRKKRNT
jgi:hypothetical protein